MKIEVCDYIRTLKGHIGEVINISDEDPEQMQYLCRFQIENKIVDGWVSVLQIKSASHNIIDLIEVGDYVMPDNHSWYEKVTNVVKDERGVRYYYNSYYDMWTAPVSIVTHEQMERMTYNVVQDNA